MLSLERSPTEDLNTVYRITECGITTILYQDQYSEYMKDQEIKEKLKAPE